MAFKKSKEKAKEKQHSQVPGPGFLIKKSAVKRLGVKLWTNRANKPVHASLLHTDAIHFLISIFDPQHLHSGGSTSAVSRGKKPSGTFGLWQSPRVWSISGITSLFKNRGIYTTSSSI